MNSFPHPAIALRAVYYGLRHRLRNLLIRRAKTASPVLDSGSDQSFARHLRVCQLLNESLVAAIPTERIVACEIGCGDCLATAGLFLGAGFERVYLVEKQTILADERQRTILERLTTQPNLTISLAALQAQPSHAINSERVRVVPEYFENATLPEKVNFLFSHDVLEHVEDLDGFHQTCARILAPGAIMVHKFDLSGHEFFEDPMPPLDFQIYPDWLYALMFPKYRRATRYFLDQHLSAIEAAGFEKPTIRLLRSAETGYVREIYPSLRTAARLRSVEQLTPLDLVLQTRLKLSVA